MVHVQIISQIYPEQISWHYIFMETNTLYLELNFIYEYILIEKYAHQ